MTSCRRRLTAGRERLHWCSGLHHQYADNHENASGVSVDPQVQRLVERIRDLTRKYLLTSAAPSSGAASPE